MHKHSSLVFLFLLLSLFTNASAQSQNASAEEVMQKVSDKLESLKTLRYTYRRELNYSSEGYFNEFKANGFLDFTTPDKIIGLKYHFENDKYLFVFNGSEMFDLNKTDKTIRVQSNPDADHFSSSIPLYDSIVTLKKALPKIIADKTILKTVSEQSDFYLVEFVLDKKTLEPLGNYFPITQERKIIYRVTVNKSDYLPREVFRGNNLNRDFTKTNFTDLAANAAAPAENTWYFSTYLNEYKYRKPLADLLIKPDAIAPDWKLPAFQTNSPISLSQFKNKVVMLEFWISFCGYCIAAVPKLNVIEEKFKNRDFKLIGINAHDSEAIIETFKKNHQPKFQLLHDGKKTAELYGVTGFPTIVLIDKSGKVIYSGKFDTERIEEIIAKNL
jgi:thiol-disulfide isomerase/thioredoxin/outer membrane lipoprotein-sorting protein